MEDIVCCMFLSGNQALGLKSKSVKSVAEQSVGQLVLYTVARGLS